MTEESTCINNSWTYNGNSGGRWTWASHEVGNGYAYAYAGYQGVPKTVTLVTYYVTNGVQKTYQSITLTNVTSAATGMTVPLCGNISSVTATCYVDNKTAIATTEYAH